MIEKDPTMLGFMVNWFDPPKETKPFLSTSRGTAASLFHNKTFSLPGEKADKLRDGGKGFPGVAVVLWGTHTKRTGSEPLGPQLVSITTQPPDSGGPPFLSPLGCFYFLWLPGFPCWFQLCPPPHFPSSSGTSGLVSGGWVTGGRQSGMLEKPWKRLNLNVFLWIRKKVFMFRPHLHTEMRSE